MQMGKVQQELEYYKKKTDYLDESMRNEERINQLSSSREWFRNEALRLKTTYQNQIKDIRTFPLIPKSDYRKMEGKS
jgi:hypothetical protein